MTGPLVLSGKRGGLENERSILRLGLLSQFGFVVGRHESSVANNGMTNDRFRTTFEHGLTQLDLRAAHQGYRLAWPVEHVVIVRRGHEGSIASRWIGRVEHLRR